MKNIINFTFFIILGLLLLIGFYNKISPWEASDDFISDNPYTTAFSTLKHPLGTTEWDQDFAVHISEAISYNVSISLKGCALFVIVGICFGLVLGLVPDIPKDKINIIKKPKYLLKFIVETITEITGSLPFLIVLIIGVLYVNYYIDARYASFRLELIIALIAFFNTHKLSVPLSDKIKSLRKEEFILAAKASGISYSQLIFKHILYYEAKSLIIIQTINFFLFAMMMEIFLTVYGLGAAVGDFSLGRLINESKQLLPLYVLGKLNNQQVIYMTILPFILIFLLCLTIRWFGQRILIITDTK